MVGHIYGLYWEPYLYFFLLVTFLAGQIQRTGFTTVPDLIESRYGEKGKNDMLHYNPIWFICITCCTNDGFWDYY